MFTEAFQVFTDWIHIFGDTLLKMKRSFSATQQSYTGQRNPAELVLINLIFLAKINVIAFLIQLWLQWIRIVSRYRRVRMPSYKDAASPQRITVTPLIGEGSF